MPGRRPAAGRALRRRPRRVQPPGRCFRAAAPRPARRPGARAPRRPGRGRPTARARRQPPRQRTELRRDRPGSALVSLALVDRASRYTLLERVGRKTADAVGSAMTRMPGPLPVHTVTADNGKEFADHARVSETLGAGFFFARHCHSRERGTDEHVNGQVAGVVPEGHGLPQGDGRGRAGPDGRASEEGAGLPHPVRGLPSRAQPP